MNELERAMEDEMEEVAMRLRSLAGLCSVLGEGCAGTDKRVGAAFDSLSFSITAEADCIDELLGVATGGPIVGGAC